MSQLQRLHPDLNAYTLDFRPELLSAVQASYRQQLEGFLQAGRHQYLLQGGKTFRRGVPGGAYYLFSYDTYPLLWFSSNRPQSFGLYQDLFKALRLAELFQELIDYQQQIRLYCGFLVIGNQAPKELWHYDYLEGAQAYTLITPLFELEPAHGGLLYELDAEQTARYSYRSSQAIILGDRFLHSTEPYQPSPKLRVLLSLTFGSDKLTYWPKVRQAIQSQSRYYIKPCGHSGPYCLCLAKAACRRALRS